MKILFVCTGNTCRSPMAKVMAQALFNEAGLGIETDSAGTAVFAQCPASKNAVKAMEMQNLDLSGHISKQITEEMPDRFDLVLTMTKGHKNSLLAFSHSPKIFTLSEYIETDADVCDPYGGDLQTYLDCARQIKGMLELLCKKLSK